MMTLDETRQLAADPLFADLMVLAGMRTAPSPARWVRPRHPARRCCPGPLRAYPASRAPDGRLCGTRGRPISSRTAVSSEPDEDDLSGDPSPRPERGAARPSRVAASPSRRGRPVPPPRRSRAARVRNVASGDRERRRAAADAALVPAVAATKAPGARSRAARTSSSSRPRCRQHRMQAAQRPREHLR
jgi:hypothetical protein